MSDDPTIDPFEPPEPSGSLRGVALTILVVVVGALLLPSATRSPLASGATSTSTTLAPVTRPSGTTTTQPTAPTTTVANANAPAASQVRVLVANATNVSGVAGGITTFLGGKAFGTLSAENALTTLATTRVYFTAAGSAAAAAEVAAALGLPASVVQPAGSPIPVSSSTGATVVVAAGQDLASRFGSPATTTTTATR